MPAEGRGAVGRHQAASKGRALDPEAGRRAAFDVCPVEHAQSAGNCGLGWWALVGKAQRTINPAISAAFGPSLPLGLLQSNVAARGRPPQGVSDGLPYGAATRHPPTLYIGRCADRWPCGADQLRLIDAIASFGHRSIEVRAGVASVVQHAGRAVHQIEEIHPCSSVPHTTTSSKLAAERT